MSFLVAALGPAAAASTAATGLVLALVAALLAALSFGAALTLFSTPLGLLPSFAYAGAVSRTPFPAIAVALPSYP